MNVTRRSRFVTRPLGAALVLSATAVWAQNPAPPPVRGAPQAGPAVTRLTVSPEKLSMKAGDTVVLKVTAYDAAGAVLPDAQVNVQAGRMAVSWDQATGKLAA